MKMKIPEYLKIATVPFPPYVEVTKNESGELILSGIEGRYLDIILKAMGLPYKVVIPLDNQWGEPLMNGSWTGIIGMLQKGEADIGMASIFITETRLAVVDFSVSYASEYLTFASHMPDPLPSSYAYVYPFTMSVWVCCFCLLLIIPLLLISILDRKYSYQYFFLQTVASILKQPLLIKENSTHGRILLIFLLFFTSIISFCYTGVLSAFLTIPLEKPPIRTFHELYEAVIKGTHRCMIWKGASAKDIMKLAPQPEIQMLIEIIENNDWEVAGQDIKSPKFFDKYTAVIVSEFEFAAYFGMEHKKTLYLMDEVLSSWSCGFALRKDFCCKERLNSVISSLSSGGFYYKLVSDTSYINWLQKSKEKPEVNRRSANDIMAFLVVFALGNALSFVALLGEILHARRHNA